MELISVGIVAAYEMLAAGWCYTTPAREVALTQLQIMEQVCPAPLYQQKLNEAAGRTVLSWEYTGPGREPIYLEIYERGE